MKRTYNHGDKSVVTWHIELSTQRITLQLTLTALWPLYDIQYEMLQFKKKKRKIYIKLLVLKSELDHDLNHCDLVQEQCCPDPRSQWSRID